MVMHMSKSPKLKEIFGMACVWRLGAIVGCLCFVASCVSEVDTESAYLDLEEKGEVKEKALCMGFETSWGKAKIKIREMLRDREWNSIALSGMGPGAIKSETEGVTVISVVGIRENRASGVDLLMVKSAGIDHGGGNVLGKTRTEFVRVVKDIKKRFPQFNSDVFGACASGENLIEVERQVLNLILEQGKREANESVLQRVAFVPLAIAHLAPQVAAAFASIIETMIRAFFQRKLI